MTFPRRPGRWLPARTPTSRSPHKGLKIVSLWRVESGKGRDPAPDFDLSESIVKGNDGSHKLHATVKLIKENRGSLQAYPPVACGTLAKQT